MKQYLELLQELVNHGHQKGDRTGTGTLSKFGHQMRFDLSKGFPLVTTKKMFTKGIILELLWFLSGSTDVKELQAQGVSFWDSWIDEQGTIGHGYGKQFRRIESLVPVTPKIFENTAIKPIFIGDLPEADYSSDTGTTVYKVGDRFTSINSGDYILLKELPADECIPRIHWLVGFPSTGYTRKYSYRAIQSNTIKDRYFRSVFCVGYYGDYDEEDDHLSVLVTTWREMLRRCYWEKSEPYEHYGKQGVFVSPEWHCFANFQVDAKKLPGWSLKIDYPNEYSLDKDVLWASNMYGKNTCIWASELEQNSNRSKTKYFTALSPDGEEVFFSSTGKAYRDYGLNLSAVHRCLNGKLRSHHGWSDFQYVSVAPGKVLRYRDIDQVKELLSELRHNQNSRRLLIALWNPQDMPRTTLPCCHGSIIQFSVHQGKLSCLMYSRSADVMLGLPVNIASYALLTHMIAQQCSLEVGEFIWTGGDVHLYLNHIEQAVKQLCREPRPAPKLVLNKAPSIFDYKFEDIVFDGYDPLPAIKADVSV